MRTRVFLPAIALALVWPGAAVAAPQTGSDAAALRQAIDGLTREVVKLRVQLAEDQGEDMRKFNANVARLNLVQGNLDRLRKEREVELDKQRDAEARQDAVRYKNDNIERLISAAQELDRTAVENRLRAQLDRDMQNAVADATAARDRIANLDTRIDRTERLVETLQRRLKIDDSQIDVVDEPPKPPKEQ